MSLPTGSSSVGLPPERRRRLQETGLRALLRRHFGPEVAASAEPVPFAGGAAVVAAPASGARLAAVFADSTAGLGAAVDLAHRRGASQLCFFCEHNDGDVARRAAELTVATTVVDPDGDFRPLAPDPPPASPPMAPTVAAARARIEAAGLETVWEHGRLLGEWLGLEVARATPDPDAPDGCWFDVGVGKHDREANRLLYPGGASDAVLDQVVALVRELRRPGAPPHPANQLSVERWVRSVVLAHPEWTGVTGLRPGPPPVVREDLRQRSVAPAWGVDAPGSTTVVVCSAGVDPDLVPQAADARLQAPGWPGFAGEAARLLVVVPEGDDHPLTRRLVGLLRRGAEVVTVPPDWRSAQR